VSYILNLISISIIPKVLKLLLFKKLSKFSRNILVVKLDGLGDYILCDPFFRELRNKYPNHKITVILFEDLLVLSSFSPYFDTVLPYNGKIKNRILKYFNALIFSYKFLRKTNFEIAIIPRWDTDFNFATLIAFLSCAKIRLGYSSSVNHYKAKFNIFYDSLLTHVNKEKLLCHESVLNLKLLESLGHIDLNYNFTLNYLKKNAKVLLTTCKDIFAIVLSAGSPARNWSINNYILLLNSLIDSTDYDFIILGTKGEIFESMQIIDAVRSDRIKNFVGKTDLIDLVNIISSSKFIFGPDTGAIQIASAFSVPSFVLTPFSKNSERLYPMHFNSPARFGSMSKGITFQPKYQLSGCSVTCIKKFGHCIEQITCNEVIDEIKMYIKQDRF